jgi:aspartate kinase
LHPSTIVPAQKYNVPVRLKNTMDEKAFGTIITEKGSEGTFKAIAAKDGITAIKIKSSRMLMAYGFLRRVFEIFESYKTPIDMIATSEVAVSLTIDNNTQLSAIETELKKFGSIEVDKDQAIICIVGNRIMDHKGVLDKVFSCLSEIPVRMVSCGGSANNVSILVDKQYKDRALNLLNEGLFGLK